VSTGELRGDACSQWSGTHAPAQDVEALGHGVEGEGNRAEGDAEAHNAAGAVRVLQRELVRRKGAEIFAHQERLHLWHGNAHCQWVTAVADPGFETRVVLIKIFQHNTIKSEKIR